VSPRWGYTHRGIYAGNGRVIHYAGLSKTLARGPVEEVPLDVFAADRPVTIRCRGPLAFERDEIVRRARSRLGENRYSVLTNNCEHFSEWAQFGLSRSEQVERWLRPATIPARLVADAVSVVRRLVASSPAWLRQLPLPAVSRRIT
jgi:hypothetical protein